MIASGIDRLLAADEALRRRRYAFLGHAAAVTAGLEPAHLALARRTPPMRLLAPEHGFHGVEQDMVPAASTTDPWTGLPVTSLYGANESTLRPSTELFAGLDLLVIDLQDVGARYYTYVATAVWAAEAAVAAGCEIWWLDRPNPLGGEQIEGPLPRSGFASFVGAFDLPVRHGLTPAEIALREARRNGWEGALRIWAVEGWQRSMLWPATGRPWLAPSPNLPIFASAVVYPGLCLLEGTEISEGRGTTRPFLLFGAPGIDPPRFTRRVGDLGAPGVRFVPALFRPQFQKCRGELCGGAEIVVVEPAEVRPFALGVRLLGLLREELGESFRWRTASYEFVSDRPAIDLLAGSGELRKRIDRSDDLEAWIASWRADEERFREERRPLLLYPEGA